MKELNIEVETHIETIKSYSYSFTVKGVRVLVEGIKSYDELLKSVKLKTKTFKGYKVIINDEI